MHIAIISSIGYRANIPDDTNCLSYYGSEAYHATLCKALLDKGHEIEWYAPHGSTEFREYDKCHFHPIIFTNGIVPEANYRLGFMLKVVSQDHSTSEDLLNCDFVIDMSMNCHDIEIIKNYHGYNNYICYRNGYAAHDTPRLDTKDKHFAVPSIQNQKLFKQAGYDSEVVKYGIPDHYSPGPAGDMNNPYWQYWDKKGLTSKEYWLYAHRPTPEKGLYTLLYLAKQFPEDVFVVSCSTPIPQHFLGVLQFMRRVRQMNLDNIAFLPSPENPRHHYFKRELYRNAKAALAPFDTTKYYEGFGLTTAEIIASGTPVLITDSESTRELWINNHDGIFCDSTGMFEMAMKHFSSYSFSPANRYTTKKYAERYEELIQKTISK